jgi:flagellar basal-body rod modification protein FlgD
MAIDGINENIFYSSDQEPKVVDANYDNSQMSQSDFLKVLLTDLQWQDPLQAEDISDFINNTVKLREMEVLDKFETSVDSFVSSIQSQTLFYASSFIGKTVEYEGNQTYVKDGKGYASFVLSQPADLVKVTVYDSSGNVVEEKTFNNLQAEQEYPIEINNPALPDGYYTVGVEAYNGNDKVDVTVNSYAYVKEVKKEDDGKVYVITDVSSIPLDKIVGVGG